MTELLIGIDVGTTWCKAAVVTPDGCEVSHGRRPTPWVTVPTGAEVDPEALAQAAVGAAIDALAAGPGGDISGIGVCSMGETGVMLDAKGEPLAPGIAWHDARGGPEAERMADDLGRAVFTRRTGLPAGPFWTAAKCEALLASHPQVAKGRRWLSVAEWVVAWLGGDEVAELSLASRTGFLDVSERSWWPDAIDRIGLAIDVMPPLIRAGTPAGRVTRVPELAGALLTVAGHDHPCASVGAGATRSGDVFDSCGTAEAIVRSAPARVAPNIIQEAVALGITVGCHVVPDRQVMLGFFKAGMALGRFLRMLGVAPTGTERDELDREALASVDVLDVVGIADDVQSVTGINERATRGDLWAAAQTAASRETGRILEKMGWVAGQHDRLVVAGGWAQGQAYRSLKRRVLGPFEIPNIAEAGVRGAALFGGLAAGSFGSVDDFPAPEMIAV